ncbi:hypothetical protein L1987_62425 [Smallanthus sonchifolius]|uniref:Uncharacterized protein n=1 Tax=Smallanthus sonchifolius TaxID=185202 RepID=A0ACB9CAM4_9ASTR|nr:hypothetical protein L1987_62425 [Smallanthus sonchifolius]
MCIEGLFARSSVAFVPHPNGIDGTSYFVAIHSHGSSETFDDQDCSDAASETSEFFSDTKEMDEYGGPAEFKASECDDLAETKAVNFLNLYQYFNIHKHTFA